MLEDPYWAYQNEDDRQSYENWQMYIESQMLEEAALTSQTLQPDDLRRLTEIKNNNVSQTETNRTAADDEDSRQPTRHQEESEDRHPFTAANSQDVQEQH